MPILAPHVQFTIIYDYVYSFSCDIALNRNIMQHSIRILLFTITSYYVNYFSLFLRSQNVDQLVGLADAIVQNSLR